MHRAILLSQPGREPADDEHERDESDHLHQDLSEGQVGSAVKCEERRHPESGDAHEHDPLEPLARLRRGDAPDDHDQPDRELGGIVP